MQITEIQVPLLYICFCINGNTKHAAYNSCNSVQHLAKKLFSFGKSSLQINPKKSFMTSLDLFEVKLETKVWWIFLWNYIYETNSTPSEYAKLISSLDICRIASMNIFTVVWHTVSPSLYFLCPAYITSSDMPVLCTSQWGRTNPS